MADRHSYPAQEKPFGALAAQVPMPALLMKLPALNSFFTLLWPLFRKTRWVMMFGTCSKFQDHGICDIPHTYRHYALSIKSWFLCFDGSRIFPL